MENIEGKELITRTEVTGTPFTIITTKGESFGVMGKYRITEPDKDASVIRQQLEIITWDRIVQVMLLLIESMENQKIE